jgi:hypothetical protein
MDGRKKNKKKNKEHRALNYLNKLLKLDIIYIKYGITGEQNVD